MGRKKIPNAIRKNWYIPKNRVSEIEEHVLQVQSEEISKTESEKLKNQTP